MAKGPPPAMRLNRAYEVIVPPRPSGVEIHQAILRLNVPHDEVHLDAERTLFLAPREICGLRALIDHAALAAGRVTFHSPLNSDLHRYLARVNFYADLPVNVEITQPMPNVRRRDCRDRLIELVRIQTARDVEMLFERVTTVAKGQFGVRTPIATACATAVVTATENAVEHADSPIGALVSAQRYQRTGLELAVVDLGSGIPTTLRQNPKHSGLCDVDALEYALEDGVSSIPQRGRGGGLAELVRDVGRVGQATVNLNSGNAELSLRWGGCQESHKRSIPATYVRGTWIAVRLHG